MPDFAHLMTPEENAFLNMMTRFAADELAPRAAETDESGAFVHAQLAALAGTGMMGANLPEAWGGADISAHALFEAVAAVAGDVVTVTAGGIRVNGEPLANSAPFRNDTEGRPMTAFPAGEYAVDAGMVWVVAGHDPRSYDSRYFGPVATAAITGTARALLIR